MTVANQIAQCLCSIEGAAADLKTFALQTQDQQSKQMFQQLSQTLEHSAQQLKGRLDYVMQEEPQYRNEIQGTYNMSTWTQGGGSSTGQGSGGYGTTTGTGTTLGGTTGSGTTFSGTSGNTFGGARGSNSTTQTNTERGTGTTNTNTGKQQNNTGKKRY